MLGQALHAPGALVGLGGGDLREDRAAGEHAAEREVHEVAAVAPDVAGEQHVRHRLDHAPRAERPAGQHGHRVLGLPVAGQRPHEIGEIAGLRHAVELEAGVARVHVEVDGHLAVGGDHALAEGLGGHVVAEEVADEAVLGEAHAAARGVDVVGRARRGAAPLEELVGVDDVVDDDRHEVLPEREDVVGHVGLVGGPHADRGGAVAQLGDGARVGLGRQVERAVGLHAALEVDRLEAAVEPGDEAAQHLGRARDLAGAHLAGGALRLDGARDHVQRDLPRVPQRDVDAGVAALRVGAHERLHERAGHALVLADERVVDGAEPHALVLERRREERLHRRGRPADLRVGEGRLDLGTAEVGRDLLGGVAGEHARELALQDVAQLERAVLEVLDERGPEPGDGAHAVDGPLDDVARLGLHDLLEAREGLALDGVVARAVDRDAVTIGVEHGHAAVPREGRLLRGRIDDVVTALHALRVPVALPVGDRVLEAVEPLPAVHRVQVLVGEVVEIEARHAAGGGGGERDPLAAHERAALVGRGGPRERVHRGDRHHRALGGAPRAHEVDVVVDVAGRLGAHDGARGALDGVAEAARLVDPRDVVRRDGEPLALERPGERGPRVRRARGHPRPPVDGEGEDPDEGQDAGSDHGMATHVRKTRSRLGFVRALHHPGPGRYQSRERRSKFACNPGVPWFPRAKPATNAAWTPPRRSIRPSRPSRPPTPRISPLAPTSRRSATPTPGSSAGRAPSPRPSRRWGSSPPTPARRPVSGSTRSRWRSRRRSRSAWPRWPRPRATRTSRRRRST